MKSNDFPQRQPGRICLVMKKGKVCVEAITAKKNIFRPRTAESVDASTSLELNYLCSKTIKLWTSDNLITESNDASFRPFWNCHCRKTVMHIKGDFPAEELWRTLIFHPSNTLSNGPN